MTTWTCTARELRRRPERALLTLLGIAIGVAILISAMTAIEAARTAYRDLFQGGGGKETLEIVGPAKVGFDGKFAAALTEVAGVHEVWPRILATAALLDSAGATPAVVIGQDSASAEDGVRVDAHTAAVRNWQPGAAIKFWTPAGLTTMTLLGTVSAQGPAAFAGTPVLYLPLATAQRLYSLKNQINSVAIALDDDRDPDEIRKAMAPRLPPGLTLQATSHRGDVSQSTLRMAEYGLAALGLIALVAAGFVVLNTVFLNLTERRSQLALLRLLGATSGQIRGLLLREAALLGATGAMLGVVVGLVLARVLARCLQGFLGVELPAPRPAVMSVTVALAAGTLLSLAATWMATWRLSRQAPLRELLHPRGTCGTEKSTWLPVVALGLAGAGALLTVSLTCNWWPARIAAELVGPSIAVLLAGCALVLPLALPLVLGACGRVLACCLALETRLAMCQLVRRPCRTGLTAGVLFLSMASAVGFGHWLLNNLRDLREWSGKAIAADYYVRASMPDSCFLMATPLPETVGQELAHTDGVAEVGQVAFVPAKVNGHAAMVLARSVVGAEPNGLDVRRGDILTSWRGLQRGEALLGSALAQRLGVAEGGTVTLETRQGPAPVRVAGIITEYCADGEALILEWTKAKELLDIPGPHAFLVTARPGAAAKLAEPLRNFCQQNRLVLQSNADLRGDIDHLVERIQGALWVLVVLTFGVASLGVVNTLTMNVLEQARELSVLRAVGMTGAQVRRVVIGQAVLTGLASFGPGCLAGIGFAALITAMSNAVFGKQMGFAVHLPLTAACFAASMLVAVVAAYLPARRAARLSEGFAKS